MPHTPGPWLTEYKGGHSRVISKHSHLPGRWGQSTVCDCGTRPNAMDDAKLMAAAPDLLEYVKSSASAGCATAEKLLADLDS